MLSVLKLFVILHPEKGSKCCLIYSSKGPDKLNVRGSFAVSL